MPARRHIEDDEAASLIRWRDLYARRYPELGLLIAIPNGGYRNAREAARLKRMGVRAGVSDYFLAVSRWPLPGDYEAVEHGLWLELKAGKNKATPEQLEWLRLMQEQGYATRVATGWVEAARAIAEYLGLPKGIAP